MIKFIKILSLSIFISLSQSQEVNDLENVNYSLNFDGIDDFVGQFPVIDNFPFSAFCWFKTIDDLAYLMQWHSNDMSGHGPHSPDLYIENGLLKAMSWSPENNDLYIESALPVNDDNWHFAGFTHDEDGTFCLYLDGDLVDCFNNPNTGREVNLILGRYNTDEKYFSGKIDNVQIWDNALSHEQIQSNMHYSLLGSESGLIGYWDFNEGFGNVLYDLTDNNYHGYIHGEPIWDGDTPNFDETIIESNSLSFDGIDDKVLLPSINLNSEFTISTWVNMSSDLAIFGDILSIGPYSLALNAVNGDWNNNEIDIPPPFVKFSLNHSNSSDGWYEPIVGLIETDEWHYITATYGNGVATLYVDGQIAGQKDMPNINIDGEIWIGDRDFSSSYSYNFDGNISELGIWNRELNQGEVITQMLSEIPNYESNLLGFWNFNKNDQNSLILVDISNYNNNGNIDGASWSPYEQILGCTDIQASNYEDNTNFDDGSCYFEDNGNHALNFSATDTWNGDYVYLGSILDFGTNSFSYSVTFNPQSLNVDWQQNILSKARHAGGYKFDIQPNTNFLRAIFSIGGTNYISVYSDELNEDTWYRATVVVNRDSSYMSLYLNGILQNIVSIYDQSHDISNIGTLRFAHNHWNDSPDSESGQKAEFFNGLIAEISFWDEALTQNDVSNIFTSTDQGPQGNLVGHWKFNSGHGDFLFDHSGFGNHGVIHGATWEILGCADPYADNYNENVTFYDGSCFGYPEQGDFSLAFNGSTQSGTDNTVIVNDNNVVINDFDHDFQSSLSIMGWVNILNNGQAILHRRNQNNIDFDLSVGSDNRLSVHLGTVGGGTSNTPLEINEWTHFAVTYNGQEVKIYLDGELDFQSGASGDIGMNSNSLGLGKYTYYGGNTHYFFYDGSLDHMSIWDISLDQEDIQLYIDSNTTGNENGLVALWKFNSGDGDILYDHSGNLNHGTIHGATWGNGHSWLGPRNSIHITGTSGYRILSSPVSGNVYGDLLEELWTQGAAGSDMPEANPNIWTYNNGWNTITDFENDILDPGLGFVIYVFSDTDYDGDDDLPVTISVDGDINEANIDIATNNSDWNLLGNPYGLALDVESLLIDNPNFSSTVYVWDNEITGYKTHNGIVGDLNEGLISPFSGFWIEANQSGNSFSFKESSIENSYGDTTRNTSTHSDSTGYGVITFESEGYESSVYVSFSESGDVNLDPADARRIVPMQPSTHLTSMIYESGKSLSINNLPFNLNNDVMYPLDVMMLEATETGYETQEAEIDISYDLSQLPEGIMLALRDNSTGDMMYLEGSSLETSLQSKGSFDYPSGHMSNYPELGESQFTLFVYGTLASVEEDIIPETYALSQAYPNPFNPSTVIGYDLPVDSYVQLDIYDITGRHVRSLVDGMVRAGKQEFTWTTNQLASGIYLVKLVTGGKTFNQKITYLK